MFWGRSKPAQAATTRVLMVCMGNICRSPTAEAVLRHKLKAAGLDKAVEVDSAGTYGGHAGEPPDARAQRHARLRGYELSRLRARRLTAEDFGHFDRVIAMDEDNLARIADLAPAGHAARVELLMAHATRHAGVLAVPDPYYGPPAGFERVLDLIEDACDGLVSELSRTRPAAAG
jgi:protein-tyrosine phosphatase